MIRSTHKLLSLNRFTLTGVVDPSGVPYTNAVQGGTPAAAGTLTISDPSGTVLNTGAMTYAAVNTWQYDAPASLFSIGALLLVQAQLTNVSGGAVLHTESAIFESPPIAVSTFKPLSLNPYELSGTDPNGTAYTSATATAKLSISDRDRGTSYLTAAAMTPAAGNTWTHVGAATTAYDPGRALRILAQLFDPSGVTLYDTELADWYPG